MNDQSNSPLGDEFDRTVRSLTGLPDTVQAGPSTIVTISPLINLAQTWIVQTYRQRERGDIILLQRIDGSGGQRFVVPPDVARAIAAQYDSLSKKNRKRGARQAYETRIAKGDDPAAALRRTRGKR